MIFRGEGGMEGDDIGFGNERVKIRIADIIGFGIRLVFVNIVGENSHGKALGTFGHTFAHTT